MSLTIPFTTSLGLYVCTLHSMSVFFLKTHLHPIGFTPSGASTSVQTWLVYMESISDFMASFHKAESISCIASSYVADSLSSIRLISTWGEIRNPYLLGWFLTLSDLRGPCVIEDYGTVSSQMDCSYSVEDSMPGIVSLRLSSSSSFLSLTNAFRNSFSRKTACRATNTLFSRGW